MSGFRIESKRKYFVWTKTGRFPTHPHHTFDAAFAEARRLAAKHPGKKFHVVFFDVKVSVRPPAIAANADIGQPIREIA